MPKPRKTAAAKGGAANKARAKHKAADQIGDADPKRRKQHQKKKTQDRLEHTTEPAEQASTMIEDGKVRCWGKSSPLSRVYHDTVWGRPHLDSTDLFGNLCLQVFATGLNWMTVLKKKDALYKAFDGFDFRRIAKYKQAKVESLLQNEQIIRHRGKVTAIINNAKIVDDLEQQDDGAFSRIVWEHQPRNEKERLLASGTHLSSHMRTDFKTKAKDREDSDGVHPSRTVAEFTSLLRSKGFKHVGETTVLCFMQAVGVMNHHETTCFAFQEIEHVRNSPKTS